MLAALGVVILAIGSLIETLDLTVAVIVSLLTVYAVIELGGAYPWMIWLTTSIVAFLLLPVKSSVLFYAFLAGYYPILKEKIERKFANLPAYLIKGGILVVACAVILGISYLFFPYLLEDMTSLPFILLPGGLAIVAFFLYDYCLTQLITFYFRRLHHRLKIKK